MYSNIRNACYCAIAWISLPFIPYFCSAYNFHGMNKLFATTIGRLRVIAFLEGISYLFILFVSMPLKYLFHITSISYAVGLAHGLLFVLYILTLVQARSLYLWDMKRTFWLLVAAILPFGTFVADRKILHPEQKRLEE